MQLFLPEDVDTTAEQATSPFDGQPAWRATATHLPTGTRVEGWGSCERRARGTAVHGLRERLREMQVIQ